MVPSIFNPLLQGSNSKENLGALRWTTRFFDFGQTRYRITSFSTGSKINLEVADHHRPSWLVIAFRIGVILTIIIPLFALAGAMIYHLVNKFTVSKPEDQLTNLLPEIQKIICEHALLDSNALSLVNKSLNLIFKKDLIFQKNRIISLAFVQSLKIIPATRDPRPLCTLSHHLIELGYEKKAFDILKKGREMFSASPLSIERLLRPMALCDLNEALKIAHQYPSYKKEMLRKISVSIVSKSFEKAYQIANSINYRSIHGLDNYKKQENLKNIAIEIAKYDIDKCLEIIQTIEEPYRNAFFIEIIETVDGFSPKKAIELLTHAPDEVSKLCSQSFLIKHYARNNQINEAIRLTNEQEPDHRFSSYICIAAEYVKIDPHNALEWVRSLVPEHQLYPLYEIIKATQDSALGKKLIEQMLELAGEKSHAIQRCAELMAKFDLPRALEIANLCINDIEKSRVLTGILRTLVSHNLPEALKCAHQVLETINQNTKQDLGSNDNILNAMLSNLILNLINSLINPV